MGKHKVLSVIGKIFTWAVIVFTVFIMVFTIISVKTVGTDNGSLFGYKASIVLTGSMQEQFAPGDIEVTKILTDATGLKAGDIITFKSIDPASYDETITHMVRSVTQYNGETAYVTYGTTTGADDTYPVPASKVIGLFSFRLPKLGYFFQYIKKPIGYVTVILIPFLLMIGYNLVHFFKLMKQYKKEQLAEIEAQKDALDAERKQAQDMMEQLSELKAKLASTGGGNGPGTAQGMNGEKAVLRRGSIGSRMLKKYGTIIKERR